MNNNNNANINMMGQQMNSPPENRGQGQANIPQNNMYPMMPAQLANLSAQQLHQLKDQPQFQHLMKNYLQRQQMMQQQQKVAKPQQVNSANPHMMGRAPQANVPNVPFNKAQNIAPNQRMFPVQNAPPQFQQGVIPPRMNSQGVRPTPTMNHGFIPNAGVPPPHPMNQVRMNVNSGGVPVMENQAHKSQTNDMMRKIPLSELSTLNEWSNKIAREGKEIPSDIKIYEQVIKRDSRFFMKYSKQLNENKRILDLLLRDIKSYTEIKQLRMNAIALSAKGQYNNSIWGEGYQGYGNGITNTVTKLILPRHNKQFSAIPDVSLTERQINDKLLKRLSQKKERALAPIRLDFDQERDRFKLRDTFLWDLDEEIFTLESFVAQLVEDYKFIPPHHVETILAVVKEQIKDFHRKPAKTMGEIRIPIKIDITINNTQLTDQFEWDILNYEDNDPEEFASVMCDEMNLPGEFSTAISHSIREQAQLFHKSLYMVGYSFDGSVIQEDEIRSHILPALRTNHQDVLSRGQSLENDDYYSILRNPLTLGTYSPAVVKLTQLELERLDKEIERESRRKRRHNFNDSHDGLSSNNLSSGRGSSRRGALHASRGGPVLPDLSEVPKTFRTPASSSILPGAIDLGVPDIYGYNEVIVHRTQGKNIANQSKAKIDDEEGQNQMSNNRSNVRYKFDPLRRSFIVKITLSK